MQSFNYLLSNSMLHINAFYISFLDIVVRHLINT